MLFNMATARVNLLYNGYHDEKHDKNPFYCAFKRGTEGDANADTDLEKCCFL